MSYQCWCYTVGLWWGWETMRRVWSHSPSQHVLPDRIDRKCTHIQVHGSYTANFKASLFPQWAKYFHPANHMHAVKVAERVLHRLRRLQIEAKAKTFRWVFRNLVGVHGWRVIAYDHCGEWKNRVREGKLCLSTNAYVTVWQLRAAWQS